MTNDPIPVRFARVLLVVDALLWLAFAGLTAAGAHPSYGGMSIYRWPVTFLALVIAALLGGLSAYLGKPSPTGYWLTIGFLAAMIVASLFDQFGLADLVFVVLTALPLVLLVMSRAWYLHPVITRKRA
jgi:uncharacterized membrane protein